MPGLFEVQLLVLAVFCGLALLFERFILKGNDDDEASHKEALDDAASSTGGLVKAADRLGLSYLGVYAVVMGMWFPQVVSSFFCCPQTTFLHRTLTAFPSVSLVYPSYPIC
jgi:hypothetical protein